VPDQTLEVSLADIECAASVEPHLTDQTIAISLVEREPSTGPVVAIDPREPPAFDPRKTLLLPHRGPEVPHREMRLHSPAQKPSDGLRETLALDPRDTRALSPLALPANARQRLPVVPPFVATPVDELAIALAAREGSAPARLPSPCGRVARGRLAPCDVCTRVIPHRPTLPTPDAVVVRRFVCDARCVTPAALYRHACPPARTSQLFGAVLFVLLAVASCVVTMASGVARADSVVAPHVPPVSDVLAAAYKTAGLDTDLGRSFATRARLAALVPWLSVRTGRDTSWRDNEPDVSRGTTLEVRATWRLDRLVFEGRELQVVSIDAARRRERRKLGQQVVREYFTWKRAARAVEAGMGDVEGAAARAEEAAAELDDLTGGWFTEQVGSSERRTLR
jgi:hypothetical protein